MTLILESYIWTIISLYGFQMCLCNQLHLFEYCMKASTHIIWLYIVQYGLKHRSCLFLWLNPQILSLLYDSCISFWGNSQYSKKMGVYRLVNEAFPYFYDAPPLPQSPKFFCGLFISKYFLKISFPAEEPIETPSGKL